MFAKMKIIIILLGLIFGAESQCEMMVGYEVAVMESDGPYAAAGAQCNIDTSSYYCNGQTGPYHGTFTISKGSNGICLLTQKSQTFGKPDQCYTYYVHSDTNSTIGCYILKEGCNPYPNCDGHWNFWASMHIVKKLNQTQKK
eukprot:734578_1